MAMRPISSFPTLELVTYYEQLVAIGRGRRNPIVCRMSYLKVHILFITGRMVRLTMEVTNEHVNTE